MFQKVCDICGLILSQSKLKALRSNYAKAGELKKGQSYGLWTLLNNKVLLHSLTGIAKEETVVYVLWRDVFFEGLQIGLSSSNPQILQVSLNLKADYEQITCVL